VSWFGRPRILRSRGCHPSGDLGPGVEAELVQGVADAAFLGAFGDEQAGADPLVDQTVRDERRDLILALP
jgi:hypothetical protein